MSSSVTEGSFHDGKLLVHIAENGHSFEFGCDEDTPVELVMQYIERFSGINCNDQLILCSGMKLEPQRSLSAYKLPSPDREVFIYNKGRLQQHSAPPSPEQVETVEVVDPPSSASLHAPHPLDEALDPALKALPSYERQFRYHYQRGHSIYRTTQVKYETCEKLLREQKVQERALEVAKSNVDQYYKVIHQNYSEFMKRYTLQHRAHSELLMNFGKDLEKLRSIKLHPALQTASRKCLVDFVKEDNLRKAVENCNNSHRQFEKKVSDFKQMFADVKRKVEELFAFRASVSIRNLEVTVKEHQRFISEQRSIMQSLSKDVDTVKKLVDDCLSSKLSSSLRPHDAVSALGPMYDVHDKNHLPKMEQCSCSISKLLEFCTDKKNEMNLFVHSYMQRVTYISYIIKDIKLQFPVFREAMVCQEDQFTDLNLVHRIGPAYRACLAEVVRRKNKMRLYMGMAGQLAERLATEREVEVRRREEFLKAHSVYIPRDILATMGLYDTPSQCDVNIAPFDTHLLEIDMSELKLYAPDYLEVLSLKSEKPASWKAGSASTSNDGSYSVETESIGVDSPQKDDSEECLKDSELLEIAGTSKLEVENAKLKAELASAIAVICSIGPDVEFEILDDSKIGSILKNSAEKTAEALQLKDDYEKHLQSLLKAKQMLCESYEKRIQELEQRLSDQYLQGQKLSASKDQLEFTRSDANIEDCKPGMSGGADTHLPYLSTSEPMDEISCISNSLDVKLASLTRQPSKGREGVDENMMDSSGIINTQLDSSMLEPHREELQASEDDGKDKMVRQMGMSLTHSSTAESRPEPLSTVPTDTAVGPKANDDLILKLQNELVEKLSQQTETESKLKATLEEVAVLTEELETRQKLLEESQMNCAHLENWLHEAREEAQTHLCAADRRASEYNVLRASAVKMRGLLERLRSCVCAPGGVAAFADSLRALSQSLANSMNEKDDDGTAEFRKCIQVLADKVGFLARHREELLERYPKLEAANEQLRKELEEKKDLVTTLFKKHQFEKQANKERISFNRLDLHEIAAFVRNSTGHYEAINRNCSNYYLSAESVALFTDHLQTQPTYIVGQIVHIERQTVKPCPHASPTAEQSKVEQMDSFTSDNETLAMNVGSTTNPYGLPVGCEYFVVTVAMLPDTTIHSSPTS